MKTIYLVLFLFTMSTTFAESVWDWGGPSPKENASFIILFNLEGILKSEMNKASREYWMEDSYIPSSNVSDMFLVERVTRTIEINRIIDANKYNSPTLHNEPVAEIFIIDGDTTFADSNILYVSRPYRINGNILQIGVLYSDTHIFKIIKAVIENTEWESFTTWSYN